jgi:hypothetical protein
MRRSGVPKEHETPLPHLADMHRLGKRSSVRAGSGTVTDVIDG